MLTPRLLTVWKQLIWSLHCPYPLLLSGGEGCGKSACVVGLAYLKGTPVRQVNITPETEPSLLIGQLMSKDEDESGM